MIVLIPAYEPDEKLLALVRQLKQECSYHILLVDDGSGRKYAPVFQDAEDLGCEVLRLFPNQGKGAALKSGFRHIAGMKDTDHEGVVCADCDGQHTVQDIMRTATQIGAAGNAIILGSRKFIGKVPIKSLFGNRFTTLTFFLSSGIFLSDTQTGLRGYPMNMLPWLPGINGNHYEYELNILLDAKKAGFLLKEIPIDTVYLENNKSSHFRPVVDSVRIYLPLIKFGISSLSAALIDFLALILLEYFTGNLLFSVIAARASSSVFNFTANKICVFDREAGHGTARSAVRYFSLVLFILACNYGLMFFFTHILSLGLVPAKLITETLLFAVSYKLQKSFVFAGRRKKLAI